MTETTREQDLLRAFATLADTLVADYDVVDLLQVLVDTCRNLLHVTASGVLLANAQGELELLASTSEASRLVELMQLGADAGLTPAVRPASDATKYLSPLFVPSVA